MLTDQQYKKMKVIVDRVRFLRPPSDEVTTWMTVSAEEKAIKAVAEYEMAR